MFRVAEKFGVKTVMRGGNVVTESHHPARWSQTDFHEAHWLCCSYVITSVEKGKAVQTNSFYLAGTGEEDKRFEDEEIRVIHPSESESVA